MDGVIFSCRGKARKTEKERSAPGTQEAGHRKKHPSDIHMAIIWRGNYKVQRLQQEAEKLCQKNLKEKDGFHLN